jgi:hypothetical protein
VARLRPLSTVLFIAGVALLFAGITRAVGFSLAGVIATAAAVGALLYAGAVWFGRPRERCSAVIFTRELIVAAGERAGSGIGDLVPVAVSAEVIARCRAALDGQGSAFAPVSDPSRRTFEALPIRSADGAIACGLLLIGMRLPAGEPVTSAR